MFLILNVNKGMGAMEEIAIIGGGLGGLSAAYALSKGDLKSKYSITVFQMGWRLGGKCATGRDPKNRRIEEHGIHAFTGSYYNALSMMEDVYCNWSANPGNPIPTFEDAFVQKNTGLHWELDGGVLKRWPKWSPPSARALKDIRNEKNLLLLWLQSYAGFLAYKLSGVPEQAATEHIPSDSELGGILKELKALDVCAAEMLANQCGESVSEWRAFWTSIKPFLDGRVFRHSTNSNDNSRRNLLETEMFQVILRGIRDDKIVQKGFKSIDHHNFDYWLEKHGASVELLESPVVAYVANLTFQFPNGDIARKPEMSAASYLQWALRSGTYVGKSLYTFAAGTGETLITPLYQYLLSRGVKFKFFHELTDIETTKSGKSVTKLHFQQQAQVKDDKSYEPVKKFRGLFCWPNKPYFSQLVNGGKISGIDFEEPNAAAFGEKVELSVGNGENKDFSKVILAIPPAAIIESAPSFLKCNSYWDDRIRDMPTIATQASQLWFKHSIDFLADMPPMINNEIPSGKNKLPEKFYYASANFPGEMHGQVDFSKYIEYEGWGAEPPMGLLYGCGVMVDPPETPGVSKRKAADLRAFETTRTTLTQMGAVLLPNGVAQRNETINPHTLDFGDLHMDSENEGLKGQDRLVDQYFRGNVYPSDRYTQSPKNTKAKRINPLSPKVKNMTGAGDWVDTCLNVGSVECTVMGGLLAAAFINDKDDANDVIGAWVTSKDSLI
jgi:uncharacterized protein with NAD-binding domain and iron-sulfur cluster